MVFTMNLSVDPKCLNNTLFLGYMNSTGRRVRRSSFVCSSLSASSTEEGFSARERLDRDKSRRCLCFDLHKEVVPYKRAWSFQKFLVERRHALTEKDEDHADMVIVLQHCPVYTLGTNSTEEYLNFEMKDAPFDIFRTERGGEVTYHGPGQLVMYPILNLRYHQMDLHWYLRSLEEVVIRVLESSFSIKATRQDGLTGVWIGNEKIAAVGIRVTRWITYHGLALNVNTDLSPFQHIVPCGIRDRQVGSIEGILKRSGCEQTGEEDLIEIVHKSLLKEFSKVFQLSLQFKSTSDISAEDSGLVATRGNVLKLVHGRKIDFYSDEREEEGIRFQPMRLDFTHFFLLWSATRLSLSLIKYKQVDTSLRCLK